MARVTVTTRMSVAPAGGQLGELRACAGDVTAYFSGLFADLEAVRDAAAGLFAAGDVRSEALSTAVEPLARDVLARHPVVGAGFVAGPSALVDEALFLAWWQGEAPQPLAQTGAPCSGAPLDYTRHEWFRVPRATGERHVTGPYVDFVCTDEYVMTSTAPVLVDGALVGVVGADTLLETFESLLLGSVRRAGATLVNHHGRTVMSADPHLPAGRLVDPVAFEHSVPCGDLPLTVLG